MPQTYYTQEEVDRLVQEARDSVEIKQEYKLEYEKACIIRAFILYTLMPSIRTAKQLRDLLDTYSSTEYLKSIEPK